MSWDSVPWMVGNGAIHSAEVGRLLAYAAARGNDGILGADDLKVTAFATPGAGVNVALGAAFIPCRAAAMLDQTYAGRMVSQDTVGIAATGAAVRNDLIVARVEDPWLAGEPWADPAVGQEGVGPYIYTRVISGVASSVIASNAAAKAYLAANAMSAVPLAGLAIPVSTATMTNAMITDLRNVANPRRERNLYTINPGATAALTSASIVDWFGSWQVTIPSWATRVVMALNIGGVRLDRSSSSVNGTAVGGIRAILGTLATQSVAYDEFAPFADATKRINGLGAADTLGLALSARGTTQTLKIQGWRASGNKNLYVDTGSFATVDVDFQEVPV